MQIKFKKLNPEAKVPTYGRKGDAALDLTAVSMFDDGKIITYDTGLALEIPNGFYGKIAARSGICNYDLILSNGIGTIDSNYRGSIKIKFRRTELTKFAKIYNIGDKIAQLSIEQVNFVTFEEAKELSDSDRGDQGWGSSGN